MGTFVPIVKRNLFCE